MRQHVILGDTGHICTYNFNQHSKNCRFHSKQSLSELVAKLPVEIGRREPPFHVAPDEILQVSRGSYSCPLITIPYNRNSNNPNTDIKLTSQLKHACCIARATGAQQKFLKERERFMAFTRTSAGGAVSLHQAP